MRKASLLRPMLVALAAMRLASDSDPRRAGRDPSAVSVCPECAAPVRISKDRKSVKCKGSPRHTFKVVDGVLELIQVQQ